MYKISIEIPYAQSEAINNLLIGHDQYNTVLNVPYDITTDANGYGVSERTDDFAVLDVYHDGDESEAKLLMVQLQTWLSTYAIGEMTLQRYDSCASQVVFEDIDLGNGWVITNDLLSRDTHSIKLNSGGSFGTGLHETTRECLRRILAYNLKDQKVLDIGTGSGILSIGALIAGASWVEAVDVRDVKDELTENILINYLDADKLKIHTGFYSNDLIPETSKFELIIVNIGGDETISMLGAVLNNMQKGGRFIVSGLVEWNCDRVHAEIEKAGFQREAKAQENEWVTMVYKYEHS